MAHARLGRYCQALPLALLFIGSAMVTPATADLVSGPNLLLNPGFETGDFNGWTVGGTAVFSGVAIDGTPLPGASASFQPNFVNVQTGSFAAFAGLGCDGLTNCSGITLTQTVSIVPGFLTQAQFSIGNDSPIQFSIAPQIFMDGLPLLPDFSISIFADSGPSQFFAFAAQFDPGTNTSATITFVVNGASAGTFGASLDTFFVRQFFPSAVPTPASLLLVISGVAALGMTARCR